MARAARWCFAAATCALLGTTLLLSGGDLASTSVLLRGALHGGASEAAEGGAIVPASEKLRRLEDAKVDMEDDFFEKPAKERLLSEEPPLRKMQTLGSCQGCTSNEVQISSELFQCVAEHEGGCQLKAFCDDQGPNGKSPCCQLLCAEESHADWNCPDLHTTICSEPPATPAPSPPTAAKTLPAALLKCVYHKGGPCQLKQECIQRWTGQWQKGVDAAFPGSPCCLELDQAQPKWVCDFDAMSLIGREV